MNCYTGYQRERKHKSEKRFMRWPLNCRVSEHKLHLPILMMNERKSEVMLAKEGRMILDFQGI